VRSMSARLSIYLGTAWSHGTHDARRFLGQWHQLAEAGCDFGACGEVISTLQGWRSLSIATAAR